MKGGLANLDEEGVVGEITGRARDADRVGAAAEEQQGAPAEGRDVALRFPGAVDVDGREAMMTDRGELKDAATLADKE